MSMTVNVRARAWGAIVTVAKTAQGEEGHVTESHEEHVLGPNEDRTFHVEPGYSVTAVHGKEPKEETATVDTSEDPPADTIPPGKRKTTDRPAENAGDPPTTI